MSTRTIQLLAALAFTLASDSSAQVLSDSLIAHFPMDGSPNDTVGGLVPEVTSGAPAFCIDRFGNPNCAACFDGASFWSYGDVLDMDTSDFVISFWFRSDSEEGSRLVTKGNTVFGTPGNAGYSFGFGDDGGGDYVGGIYVYDDQANESSTAVPVEVSQWTHMVASRCDTILSVHVNGQLYSQVPTESHGDLSTNIVFALGALDRNPTSQPDGSFFTGALDDLRIYKGRCLSQAEIDTLAGNLQAGADQWLHFPDNITGNAVNIGDLDIQGDQITLEALVTRNPSQGVEIVSKHSNPTNVNYLFRVNSLEITTETGYMLIGADIELCPDSVYHLAATYDGAIAKYYVNGVVIASAPKTGDLIQNSFQAYIGNNQALMNTQLEGYIDELRIWSVARTQQELIDNMYSLANPTAQTGLRAYYTFDGDYVNQQNPGAWDGTPIGPDVQLAMHPTFDGAVDELCLSTGLSDSPRAIPLMLGPNPSTGALRIDLPTPMDITSPITVVNSLAQEFRPHTSNLNMVGERVQSLTVDVSDLPIGAYFVVVPTEKGRLHGRFIKE